MPYDDCLAPVIIRDEDMPTKQGAYSYDCPVCRRGIRFGVVGRFMPMSPKGGDKGATISAPGISRGYTGVAMPGGQPWAGQTNWLWQMINTPRPLQEKMTLFWYMVFATGNSKVDNTNSMMTHIGLFREHGLGNYQELLVELAKDPAMIYWLDNNENHKDQPNENWGRELLELFSMGQGNYTEEDVYECARAFTGWTISGKLPRFPYGHFPWHFIYDSDDHDDSEKKFLGQLGRFNGEDVIDIIVRQPATARFIARHLYNFFVADEVQVPSWLETPPRAPVAIDMIVGAFVSSGYEMKDTLRVIFHSEFFKSARFQKVKNPLEVVVGTMNLVGDFKGFPKPGLVALGLEPGARQHGPGPTGPAQR